MKKFLGLVSLVMLVAATPVMAMEGKALYAEKGCSGCHGEGGLSTMAMFPNLRGQNAAYTAKQVVLIRDGKRTSGQSSTMKGAVAGVTDTEINAIADYLSKQ